ncbi:MAG: hypothetical protein JW934_23335 [Anaerolineae bacterium]|nr:hypothetical protein [Anaerolineae bacterium]
MKGKIALVTLLLTLLVLVWPISAQEAIKVIEDTHNHVFKDSTTFKLEVSSSSDIDSIKLFYRVSGQKSANKVELEFAPGKTVSVEHTEDMADPENYFPPMIEFTYWWQITDIDGNRLKTEPVTFVYEDTNYTWQTLESDLIRLYWHDQDADFGQHFFDLAVESARLLHEEFGVETARPVQIAIYNSHEELMAVLQEASSEWTGAVTFNDTGCIAIGLGPMSWMDKVIPHELTHATLYMITNPPFGDIPRWLHEGLAMRSEGGMSVEERSVLADAIKDNTLIALRVLNSNFPDERERAILSYAESYSLITFIIDEYGTDKLGELIGVFARGAHYDDALIQVFGADMDGMEDLWREHIGASPREGHTRATPQPTVTPTVEPTATQPSLPTQTLAVIAAATATPIPPATPTTPPVPTSTPIVTPTPTTKSGPCLGALPVLGFAVLFVSSRPRSNR